MDEALERHRVRWRMRGLPIFDDDDDQIGVTTEPEWTWDELADEQRSDLRAEAQRFVDRSPDRLPPLDPDFALWYLLSDYGIACPHLRWEYHEPTFRECRACRTIEPLPGRVVDLDGTPARVPDPPPLRWRVPRPVAPSAVKCEPDGIPDPALAVDEYEWDGRRYHKIASR